MQMRFENGKQKTLTLSYDDSCFDNERLYKTLNKYGIKATFNINSVNFDPERNDNGTEFIEMMKGALETGHEIAVHGYSHPWTATLKDVEIIKEIIDDRKTIEKHFGIIARGMAYPFGCFNERTINVLKSCGIVYSRTTVNTHGFHIPDNWMELPATCHHDDSELMTLAERFVNENPRWGNCLMFYLWGHAYEFERNNNWETIEKFAEYIGNRDDIYYATNIQIYDYIEAYNRLQTSADMSIVYNPSAIPVWFEHNQKVYCISAGETLNI